MIEYYITYQISINKISIFDGILKSTIILVIIFKLDVNGD